MQGQLLKAHELPYIFVIVKKEATEYVNGQDLEDKRHLGKRKVYLSSFEAFLYMNFTHPQSTFRLDVHYGQYSLVENRIAYIFTRLCVRCNL